MKTLDGREIRVELSQKSTLYVANYPPTADEAYIRNLFSEASPWRPRDIELG
jgi:squamous cell carcinoma antigen recognized by T-cells 3